MTHGPRMFSEANRRDVFQTVSVLILGQYNSLQKHAFVFVFGDGFRRFGEGLGGTQLKHCWARFWFMFGAFFGDEGLFVGKVSRRLFEVNNPMRNLYAISTTKLTLMRTQVFYLGEL